MESRTFSPLFSLNFLDLSINKVEEVFGCLSKIFKPLYFIHNDLTCLNKKNWYYSFVHLSFLIHTFNFKNLIPLSKNSFNQFRFKLIYIALFTPFQSGFSMYSHKRVGNYQSTRLRATFPRQDNSGMGRGVPFQSQCNSVQSNEGLYKLVEESRFSKRHRVLAREKTRPPIEMIETPPRSILPLVLLLLLTVAQCQEQSLQCKQITGYKVCERKGTLVDVTQQEFEERLDIHDMNLLSIREGAFKNLSTTKLSLGLGNKISVVGRESFKGLDKLVRLDLDSNLVQLSPNLFSELKQLNSLSLIFNKINDIPKDTFAGLSNLMWLYLGHNDIRSISKNSFTGLSSSLLFLWLNDNKISSVESGTFGQMPELTRLHLENNKLTSIQQGVLKGLHKLDGLFLEYNQLGRVSKTDFKGLIGLRILNLHHNQIDNIEEGAFSDLKQLEQLDLRKNRLSTIEARVFNGLTSLKKLDLSDNRIGVVQLAAFQDLPALKTLNLANNNLTSVDRKEFGLTSLTILYT